MIARELVGVHTMRSGGLGSLVGAAAVVMGAWSSGCAEDPIESNPRSGGQSGSGGSQAASGGSGAAGGQGGSSGIGGSSGSSAAGGSGGSGGVSGAGGAGGISGTGGAGTGGVAGGDADVDSSGGDAGTGGSSGVGGTAGASTDASTDQGGSSGGSGGSGGGDSDAQDGSGPVNLFAGSGFESGTEGWIGRGSAAVQSSSELPHSGAMSLKVTGRTANWHGTEYNLLNVAMPGVPYTVTVWARLAPGSPTSSLILTRQFQGCSGGEFARIQNASNVASDVWVRLSGTLLVPADCTPTRVIVYVESSDTTAELFVDDVSLYAQ